AKTRPNRSAEMPCGSSSIEQIVDAVRAVWQAIEDSRGADQAALKQEISDAVQHLKDRIDRKLRATEPRLFDVLPKNRRPARHVVQSPRPRFPEPKLRVYAKDLANHALKYIPKLAGCQSIEDIRTYLTSTLPFNSQATRRRNANYLISRFFPGL